MLLVLASERDRLARFWQRMTEYAFSTAPGKNDNVPIPGFKDGSLLLAETSELYFSNGVGFGAYI